MRYGGFYAAVIPGSFFMLSSVSFAACAEEPVTELFLVTAGCEAADPVRDFVFHDRREALVKSSVTQPKSVLPAPEDKKTNGAHHWAPLVGVLEGDNELSFQLLS